jgi:hypothetical protein
VAADGGEVIESGIRAGTFSIEYLRSQGSHLPFVGSVNMQHASRLVLLLQNAHGQRTAGAFPAIQSA